MKFKKSLLLMILVMMMFTVFGCHKKTSVKKITIAEVAHSVFYAPLYASIELGYFKDYDMEVDLINANGADKVMASLLSHDAQIGLMGPEASIYVKLGKEKNYAVNFCLLTKTDGSFIVGRKKEENFSLLNLKGKSILGGRIAGLPEMTLEYVLKKNGLLVAKDDESIIKKGGVNIRTDIAFQAMAGSFISGEADYTTLFEPTATILENNNQGYILSSVGKYAGEVPYTAFSALKSYLKNNEEIIQDFTNAIYKGQKWVLTHEPVEVAEVIKPHFSSSSIEELTKVMERYKNINAWAQNPYFSLSLFNNLTDIMTSANELKENVSYNELIDNKYALESMKKS